MITPEQGLQLQSRLTPIYSEMLRDTSLRSFYEDEPWREPWCFAWTPRALPIARKVLEIYGIKVNHVVYHPDGEVCETRGLPYEYHEYLIASDLEDGTKHVVDGTWSQFQNTGQEVKIPHILIAPVVETPNIIMHSNISDDMVDIWRPDLHPNDVFSVIG